MLEDDIKANNPLTKPAIACMSNLDYFDLHDLLQYAEVWGRFYDTYGYVKNDWIPEIKL